MPSKIIVLKCKYDSKNDLSGFIKSSAQKKGISLIIGPRQAGKTTLMLLVQKYLEKKGAKTLFLSLDFESDQQFFTSQKNLTHKIELEIGKIKGEERSL